MAEESSKVPTLPTQEDISSLLNSIFTAPTSSASIDACYTLCNRLLVTIGFRGLHHYGIIEEIKRAAADKKSGLRRESAQNLLGALFETFPARQPISEIIFLIQDGGLVSYALDALGDKGSVVRDAAQYGVDVLFANLSTEALVVGLLPSLVRYISNGTGRWQGTVGALKLIQKMADKATLLVGCDKEESSENDFLRAAIGTKLEVLIPVVEDGLHNLKRNVETQAVKTMMSLATLPSNDDIAARIPLLVNTMQHPSTETLQRTILALSQTAFVVVVTSSVLALLTPILERSLLNPATTQETLRQTILVIENLVKLVHDPVEARSFVLKFEPEVQGVANRATLPEVREVALRTLNAMDETSKDNKNAIKRTSAEHIARILDSKLAWQNNGFSGDTDIYKLTRQYVCEMIAENIDLHRFDRIPLNVARYIKPLMQEQGAENTIATAVQCLSIEAYHHKLDQSKEEGGETEIVNAHFSLGYGGRLLLSHANLRLLQGHRYGIIGQNGVGKSTLLRSIAEGKLEGFPSHAVLRPCYVEYCQGEGTAAGISALEYICKDRDNSQGGTEYISKALAEFGFTPGPKGLQAQEVGSLSGGNKMKLNLARAILQKPDMLLLDEPTNHLDVDNVKWLEKYLNSRPDITSLIVSHDTNFLDQVATDIYHFEADKTLAHFKGNLAAFIKFRPEIKSYYTLTAIDSQYTFPPPGILTGIKSHTKAVIRMVNVSYTYPYAPQPALLNVTCQLSLSSRAAIIGPNGAGKSTLIKLLTGEVVPTGGKVEQHPNLRIGYIKQHALEHVESHREKTPSQYLQWRYSRGDDREVYYKQTRLLSETDQIQIERFIDFGEGKGARQIEALMGRQKHLKSFKYEVKWRGWQPKYNTMVTRETLIQLGFHKLVQGYDDYESSRKGLEYRDLTLSAISEHFQGMGLDPEIANHTPIASLSGGQKVKVVFAAALWPKPHIFVLDEPTNFLDRSSLGALTVAIREFRGGVIMISHKDEFVGALASEYWFVDNGHVTYRSRATPTTSRQLGGEHTTSSSFVLSAHRSTDDGEDRVSEMHFKTQKTKKMTKKELKGRKMRRRLRHIEWLSSPKGTPRPPDTDDES